MKSASLFTVSVLLLSCAPQVVANPPALGEPRAELDARTSSEGNGSISWPSSAGLVRGTCDGSDCRITVGNRLALEVWHYGNLANLLSPLGAVSPWATDIFFIGEHHGDGCPVMYRMLCIREDDLRVTEPFGNCESVGGMTFGKIMSMEFPEEDYGGKAPEPYIRPRQTWQIDSQSCAATLKGAE